MRRVTPMLDICVGMGEEGMWKTETPVVLSSRFVDTCA